MVNDAFLSKLIVLNKEKLFQIDFCELCETLEAASTMMLRMRSPQTIVQKSDDSEVIIFLNVLLKTILIFCY